MSKTNALVGTDDVDDAILAILVRDARLSARAVAREIGMSPNAVSERIDRLQERGVITGYHAQLNPEALGFGMVAFVGLQTLHGPTLRTTFSEILNIPEVEQVHVVTGQWDVILQMRVRDHAHLENVLIDKVWHLNAFRHSETMIALRSHQRVWTWVPPNPSAPANSSNLREGSA